MAIKGLHNGVIPCQLNQRSPAQIFDFANIFSGERQTCIVMKAKIWNVMDEYLLNNQLEGGQNDNFHLRLRAKSQRGKNDFRKMAASYYFMMLFYTEIGRSDSKICSL